MKENGLITWSSFFKVQVGVTDDGVRAKFNNVSYLVYWVLTLGNSEQKLESKIFQFHVPCDKRKTYRHNKLLPSFMVPIIFYFNKHIIKI